MQYQVLARKWRPQNFHEIVGQEHVSRTLHNALESGRVAHAFLFSGPRGSGKTSTARILAKALNCHEGSPVEPCGRCPSCTEIAAGNSIDVLEIDAASNTSVDNVRQLIEQARYQPARDRHKIFIIDEVHMLSNAAFSALLKTLEEPPSHVVFIMATTEYQKIPVTILSRCQQYTFKLIAYPLILDRLRRIADAEGISIGDGALEQVAFSSGGSMRDAMSALDQVLAFSGNQVRDTDVVTLLGLVEPKVLGRTVRAIASGDIPVILETVGELVEAGQDLQVFCRRLIGHFRNLTVLKSGVEDLALLGIPGSTLPDLREQAALFSREDLLRLFETLLGIDGAVRHAAQARFQLEMGLIELAHLAKLRPLEDLIAEFSALAETGPAPPAAAGAAPAAPRRRPDATPVPRPPAAREIRPPRGGERREAPAVRAVPVSENEAPAPEDAPAPKDAPAGTDAPAPKDAPGGTDPRKLLLQIASAVGREPLESMLAHLEGARLEGDAVILEMGSAKEFFRSQISESLPAIEQAASLVAGAAVRVRFGESGPPTGVQSAGPPAGVQSAGPPTGVQSAPGPDAPAGCANPDLLEKAKKEPVVRSFLDTFTGPVDVEKIHS